MEFHLLRHTLAHDVASRAMGDVRVFLGENTTIHSKSLYFHSIQLYNLCFETESVKDKVIYGKLEKQNIPRKGRMGMRFGFGVGVKIKGIEVIGGSSSTNTIISFIIKHILVIMILYISVI